jgi:hypothetical protein
MKITRKDLERPQPDYLGAATDRELFVSVGKALTTWEHVEEQLAALYSFLASPSRYSHAAFRSYGTLTATRPRRLMIEAAAEIFFVTFPDAQFPAELTEILTIYSDAGARRNEIAHGVSYEVSEDGPDDSVVIHHLLLPALHSTNKTDHRLMAEYRFNSKTIDRLTDSFDQLGLEVERFFSRLKEFYSSLPEGARAQY